MHTEEDNVRIFSLRFSWLQKALYTQAILDIVQCGGEYTRVVKESEC